MERKHAAPKGHWNWPIPLTHRHGVRAREMMFVGSQKVLDRDGAVLHADDLWSQLQASVDSVERVLEALNADLGDVVKLVLYTAHRDDADEGAILRALGDRFAGVPPALMHAALPALAYPGQMVEIEATAMREENGARMARTVSNPEGHRPGPFSHGVRCGEMIFIGAQSPLDAEGAVLAPGDPVEQAKINIENIRAVLDGFGAVLDDTCRINTFYVGHGTARDWARAGAIRGNAFAYPGPCGTGVPVPSLSREGLTIRQEVIAMLGAEGQRLPHRTVCPDGHWDWPIPMTTQQGVRVGDKVFVGGQSSLDAQAKTLHEDDLAAQTRVTMDYIASVLAGLGATMDDVVMLKGYHTGGADAARLHETLEVSASYFGDPGPATTDVPLHKLGIEGMSLETDAFAITD